MIPLRVFIGFDPREAEAYDVCAHSLRSHASVPIAIEPLELGSLRARGLYWRPDDPRASTEFTYSRFLVPELTEFKGWALFCDCDFLFRADVLQLLARANNKYSVMCVQHDHQPRTAEKMDGIPQSTYPRKNWSSLMLINCEHRATGRLNTTTVNRMDPGWLHQMRWATDDQIGALDEDWNWLVGVSPTTRSGITVEEPKAVHFTDGGPWFPKYRDVPFADEWRAMQAEAQAPGREKLTAGTVSTRSAANVRL